jgi:uncharacterized repeat protein (TIGR03803 family)
VESRPVSLQIGGVPAQTQETVLYGFGGGTDGANPTSELTDVNGVLYGTTYSGGTDNDGTVFKITTAGAESVLYTFAGGSDGAHPFAGLTNVNGVLYGTTRQGGANNGGTVFKITTSGAETVLHTFGAGSDGSAPLGGLTSINGVLYGTTSSGGGNGFAGTVFEISTSGTITILHRFGGPGDGFSPTAGLTDVDGVLYGTTIDGGANQNNGTVFKITTSGVESVLHSFKGGSDGRQPDAELTNVNGILYGTTYYGGSADRDDGTVFKVSTAGALTVIHSFGGGNDGKNPDAGLTNAGGVLYGTTYAGGVYNRGTIFRITTAGTKSTVYRFGGSSDGAEPRGSFTNVNGVLYGTTDSGGATDRGTVFSLSL